MSDCKKHEWLRWAGGYSCRYCGIDLLVHTAQLEAAVAGYKKWHIADVDETDKLLAEREGMVLVSIADTHIFLEWYRYVCEQDSRLVDNDNEVYEGVYQRLIAQQQESSE